MSVLWLKLVRARAREVCTCQPCSVWNLTRPPVELCGTRNAPRRWLHGAELDRFYREEDAAGTRRDQLFARLKKDLAAKGIGAQRGDEPR